MQYRLEVAEHQKQISTLQETYKQQIEEKRVKYVGKLKALVNSQISETEQQQVT